MKTSAEIRQANILKVLEGFSNDVDLATKLGKHRNQVFLWKTKAIGDRAAREIERGLGYERGWMDHEHDKDMVPNYPKLYDEVFKSLEISSRSGKPELSNENVFDITTKLAAKMRAYAGDKK